jgi:hypothetical protein
MPGAAVPVVERWDGAGYLKIRSGTRAHPVTQREDVSVTIALTA